MEKPDGLGVDGSFFWDEVTHPERENVLKPDEYHLLEMACRQLDLLATLHEEFEKDGRFLTQGSAKQDQINPILAHTDKVINRFQALCRQLMIPDDDEHRAHQRAAQISGDMAQLGKLSWASRKSGA